MNERIYHLMRDAAKVPGPSLSALERMMAPLPFTDTFPRRRAAGTATHQNIPKMIDTPESLRKRADELQAAQEREAAATAARIAAEQALQARKDAAAADLTLAQATITLLGAIGTALAGVDPGPRIDLAKHRKTLQPLAAKHGYKIVLVGDKSRATLVEM